MTCTDRNKIHSFFFLVIQYKNSNGELAHGSLVELAKLSNMPELENLILSIPKISPDDDMLRVSYDLLEDRSRPLLEASNSQLVFRFALRFEFDAEARIV